jgi:superfamily II DNA or RNA helicase
MTLYAHQEKLSAEIDVAFDDGHRNVLATMATGGGKTVMISHRASLMNDLTMIMAHRQELVFQLAMALARDGLEHRIVAPEKVEAFIIRKQVETYGRKFVYGGAQHFVASVDTLLARQEDLGKWPAQIELTQPDEAHHVLGARGGDTMNKWGRACRLFPNSLLLGWTATAGRPDRKPLRSSFTALVEGPTARELLSSGYLCPYRVYGPPSSIDMHGAELTAGGDWSKTEIARRAHKSTITGDLLAHYLKYAPGKIGIGFLVDVEQAKETAARFNAAGIPSAWMSSKETDDATRVKTMEALRRGDIRMLFNVDLLGEGVDVPRVEVILDGRPTMSIVRYLQVFGRLLRLFDGKQCGIYIDAVGNVMRHGLPDTHRVWSLDEIEKRKRLENGEDSLTTCTSCFNVYSRLERCCPECGFKPVAGPRAGPEQLAGDLTEFSEELLSKLRGDADRIMAAAPKGAPSYVADNINRRFVAQQELREAMEWWAGVEMELRGKDLSKMYRTFYLRFGVDMANAQLLGRPQAEKLTDNLWEDINNESSRPTWRDVEEEDVWSRPKAPSGEGKFRSQASHNGKRISFSGPTQEAADTKADEYRKLHNLPPKRFIAPNGEGKFRAAIMHNGKRIIFLGPTREAVDEKRDEYRRKHEIV